MTLFVANVNIFGPDLFACSSELGSTHDIPVLSLANIHYILQFLSSLATAAILSTMGTRIRRRLFLASFKPILRSYSATESLES